MPTQGPQRRTARLRARFAAAGCLLWFGGAAGCNAQRKQECDAFLSAMTPLQEGTPSDETVDRVRESVSALEFQDQPLREYATNYKNTLAVLSGTLKLKAGAGPDGPPDGTEDVIKKNLKEARTDRDDIARYCTP